MKRSNLERFVNKIVCFDLSNHERPVGKLVEVTDEHVVLKNPYVYIAVPTGQSIQVQPLPYGAPLFDVKSLTIGYEHIIDRLDIQSKMEQAYIQQTTGLVTEPSIIIK